MNNNKYILILVLSIGIFGVSIFLNYILLDRVSSMKVEADTNITNVISKQKMSEYYKGVKNLSLSSKGDREKIDQSFVDYNDTVKFIEQIEKTADLVGVKLDIGNLSDNTKKDEQQALVGQLDFNVNIIGSWDKVTRFVLTLESLPYKIVLNNVQFNKTGSEIIKPNEVQMWRAGISFSVLTKSK